METPLIVSEEAAVVKLRRDIREAATTIGVDEARFLVDAYYSIQKMRVGSGNQVSALAKSTEPHELLRYVGSQYEVLEKQIHAALDKYSGAQEIGRWARGVRGIGPVLASGLICHIDIHQAPTVGHIWSFAGLNPTAVWEKGKKRPWNADLKVICWKIGESFVKAGGEYGDILRERKAYEIEKNGKGDYSDQAAATLERKRIGKDTDAYKYYSGAFSGIKLKDSGFVGVPKKGKRKGIQMLPPAHIHARACRYAVKLFLSHLHAEWYRIEFKKEPPLPYPIEHLGHVHIK